MNFAEAITSGFQKYAQFSGRSRRSEYWWWVLFTWLIALGINLLITRNTAFAFIALLVWLGLLIPSLAVAVRRLHDTGRSGWFLLIGLIPLVGFIILIVWLATAGDPGVNEFGMPPGAEGTMPVLSPTPGQPTPPPPGWHPDPSGRHEYRYWDGTTWTENVADGGVTTTDPL